MTYARALSCDNFDCSKSLKKRLREKYASLMVSFLWLLINYFNFINRLVPQLIYPSLFVKSEFPLSSGGPNKVLARESNFSRLQS